MRVRSRRGLWAPLLAGFGWLSLWSPVLAAQDTTSFRLAQITYLTASTAYVSAGSQQGVREGDRMEVVRRDSVIGILEVAYLSTRRSSCTIVSRTATIAVDDQVRYRAGPPPEIAAAEAKPPATVVQPRSASRKPGLHGRVGARYLAVRQREGDARYSQPAVELRLDGPLGGSGLTLIADARARRTSSSRADGGSSEDPGYRVYGLALGWTRVNSPLRITIGRQFSAPLANVNLFDGISADFVRPSWASGLFAGSQPSPDLLGFSTEVKELGGYLQAHNRPGVPTRWSVTAGAVGSYVGAEINREFLFLRSTLYTTRLSAYVHQELDVNRGWKADAGEPAFAPTSTYVSFSLRPSPAVTLRGGFDNRRSIRLYRDFVNPETRFDDSFREGYWAGAGVRYRQYQAELDGRRSSGGSGGQARSFTLTLGATRILGADLGLRTRSTRYVGSASDGWLHSASLGWTFVEPVHVEANAGWRRSSSPLDNPEISRTSWVGVDLDVRLGRAWYALLSINRESGAEATDQVYGGISFNF